ncbi:MAG: hypothetical protein WCL32_02375 [Planctomycetota bacterium]
MRHWISLTAMLFLVLPVAAGGDGLAGNWKVTIFEDGQYLNFWLVTLDAKDGKLTGEAQVMSKIPETTVTGVKVDGDLLKMAFKLANGVQFNFEGKLPRVGGKKFYGSITRGSNSTPAFFESTPAKTAFDANLEVLTRSPSDPRVFSTLLSLIGQAKEKKIPARDVQEWIDGVIKTAESYGPIWQTEFGIKLVTALQTSFPTLAAETGAKIEKSFDAKTSIETQLRLLTALGAAYDASGQAAEAAKITARLAALEGAANAENTKNILSFKIDPYKGKTRQAVLVELFTGAQCPPCVAADIGFDALGKAFSDEEVVLLQYHLHVPSADALTNPDTEARADFYAKSLRGTPAIFFNGKAVAPGGGGRDDGEEKYQEYRSVVEKMLTREPGGRIALAANRKADLITIQADVSEVAPGKVKLRFALVEDWARYKGRNGLTFHHHIVRAMPGGPDGFAVDKALNKTVTIDIAELRLKLGKYLDNYAKTEEEFPDAQRPMRMQDLRVAAFLQNDETGEVLQAISVPVK